MDLHKKHQIQNVRDTDLSEVQWISLNVCKQNQINWKGRRHVKAHGNLIS